MISVKGLRYSIGSFTVATDCVIFDKEYFVLLGASGSGKTLFLENLCGILEGQSGQIVINDLEVQSIPPRKRNIGYVPQDGVLFEHLNVYGNIAYSHCVKRIEKSVTQKRVNEIASLLNISHLLHRAIKGLSGGECQRVALGRALLSEPSVLLLDEPVSALDEALRESVCRDIRKLQKELGLTVIHVCHSLDEARIVADRVGIMSNGSIIQTGTLKDLYNHPKNKRVAELLRCDNVFKINDSKQRWMSELVNPDNNPWMYIPPWSIAFGETASKRDDVDQLHCVVDKMENEGPYIKVVTSDPHNLSIYFSPREIDYLKISLNAPITVTIDRKSIVFLTD